MKTFKKPDGSIWAFEEDGSQDHLIANDMTQYAPPVIDNSNEIKISEIQYRFNNINLESVRPMRAIYAGTDTPDDHAKLEQLENEAIALRKELENLK